MEEYEEANTVNGNDGVVRYSSTVSYHKPEPQAQAPQASGTCTAESDHWSCFEAAPLSSNELTISFLPVIPEIDTSVFHPRVEPEKISISRAELAAEWDQVLQPAEPQAHETPWITESRIFGTADSSDHKDLAQIEHEKKTAHDHERRMAESDTSAAMLCDQSRTASSSEPRASLGWKSADELFLPSWDDCEGARLGTESVLM